MKESTMEDFQENLKDDFFKKTNQDTNSPVMNTEKSIEVKLDQVCDKISNLIDEALIKNTNNSNSADKVDQDPLLAQDNFFKNKELQSRKETNRNGLAFMKKDKSNLKVVLSLGIVGFIFLAIAFQTGILILAINNDLFNSKSLIGRGIFSFFLITGWFLVLASGVMIFSVKWYSKILAKKKILWGILTFALLGPIAAIIFGSSKVR